MRKKNLKTLFIMLVLIVISSLVISACSVDLESIFGTGGSQGKGKAKGQANDNDADDDDSGNQGQGQGQGQGQDKGNAPDDDTGDDDDSGNQGQGQGQGQGQDKGNAPDDDTGDDDVVIDDGPENDKGNLKNKKITLCHATGSETNPYVEITVADDGVYNGHIDHEGDIIPAPDGGCPGPEKTKTPKPPNEKITLCHATGSATNPYVEITVSVNAVNYAGHGDHENDIIPAPAEGCPGPEETPTPPPNPDKVNICHATGSEKNPFVFITVADDGAYNGHINHEGDIFDVESAADCPGPDPTPTPSPTPTPTVTPTPEPGNTYVCHYTGDAGTPYEVVEVPNESTLGGHATHTDDIYPVPDGGCPGPDPTPEPHPDIEPEAAGVCVNFIVFHSLREGSLEIYRLDGSENDGDFSLINLSQGPSSQDLRPARSWDDSQVAFESTRNGNFELYLTSSGGGLPVQLTYTTSNNINPIFVAGDKKVLFQSDRNGNWDVFSIDLASGEERQLTTDPNDDIYPFPSPDANWITFQSNRNGNWDIYLLNVNTGEEFAFATSAANETLPTWSPDGKHIAFLSDYAGETDLWVQNVETGEKFALTWGAENTANNPSWSPDGTRIAYQSTRNDNLDIFTYDLETDTEYRATNFVGGDTAPTWDCAGQNVSFTSNRDNDINVLQVFWQGGENFFITNDPAVDKWSQWSPSKEQGSRGQ